MERRGDAVSGGARARNGLHFSVVHELFRLEETVPLAPGTSPFHVRGVYYLRVLEHAKSLPGGLPRFLDELVDARVRDFLRQRFQFMHWYDAFPTLPCGVALSRIRGLPFEVYMRERGQQAMLALAPSMFRLLSRVGGPRFAASHAPRLIGAHFDFLEVQLLHVSDFEGSATVSSVPRYAAPAIVNVFIGITAGALECLGASGIEGSYREVTTSSSNSGFDMVAFRVELKWRLERAPAGRITNRRASR